MKIAGTTGAHDRAVPCRYHSSDDVLPFDPFRCRKEDFSVIEETQDPQIFFYDSLILSPTMRRSYGD